VLLAFMADAGLGGGGADAIAEGAGATLCGREGGGGAAAGLGASPPACVCYEKCAARRLIRTTDRLIDPTLELLIVVEVGFLAQIRLDRASPRIPLPPTTKPRPRGSWCIISCNGDG
jgi:hypothetical protein